MLDRARELVGPLPHSTEQVGDHRGQLLDLAWSCMRGVLVVPAARGDPLSQRADRTDDQAVGQQVGGDRDCEREGENGHKVGAQKLMLGLLQVIEPARNVHDVSNMAGLIDHAGRRIDCSSPVVEVVVDLPRILAVLEENLFDIAKDAGERNDLLAGRPDEAVRLKAQLAAWEMQVKPTR